MPLYDFACPACQARFEDMAAVEEATHACPIGGELATRLLSFGQGYRSDAPWIDSVTAVVEKGSGKPHVDAFLAAPNRDTYRNWMRGEGLRLQEPGEQCQPRTNTTPLRREVTDRFRARRALA